MSELGFRVSAELLKERDELRTKLHRRSRLIWRLVERNKALKAEIAELNASNRAHWQAHAVAATQIENLQAQLAAAGEGWISAESESPPMIGLGWYSAIYQVRATGYMYSGGRWSAFGVTHWRELRPLPQQAQGE